MVGKKYAEKPMNRLFSLLILGFVMAWGTAFGASAPATPRLTGTVSSTGMSGSLESILQSHDPTGVEAPDGLVAPTSSAPPIDTLQEGFASVVSTLQTWISKVFEIVNGIIGLINRVFGCNISKIAANPVGMDSPPLPTSTGRSASSPIPGNSDGTTVSGNGGMPSPDFEPTPVAAPISSPPPSGDRGPTPGSDSALGSDVPRGTVAGGGSLKRSYFVFVSPSDETGHPEGVKPSEITAAIQSGCNGDPKKLLVGFDVGGLSGKDLTALAAGRIQEIENPGLKLAAQKGCGLHAYVEGPGGVTDGSWSQDEKQRIIAAARSIGITIGDPSDPDDPGTIIWNRRGWRDYTRKQLISLKRGGFETAEIDNLYNDKAVGDDETGAGTVAFFKEYAEWWRKGEVPRIVPKNLTVSQWRAVIAAIRAGQLPRGMFADFSVAEKDVEDRQEGARLSATVGISGLFSNDTENYDASGAIK